MPTPSIIPGTPPDTGNALITFVPPQTNAEVIIPIRMIQRVQIGSTIQLDPQNIMIIQTMNSQDTLFFDDAPTLAAFHDLLLKTWTALLY